MMAKNVVKSKCRLIADKINKYERKGLSEVILVYQGYEESDFWQLLGGMPGTNNKSRARSLYNSF